MTEICGRYFLTNEMIGYGTFSQVFKGIGKSNEIVAIKCINWFLIKDEQIDCLKKSIIHEISCMSNIYCRHIVKFIDVEHISNTYEDKTYIVMEYCEGGDLADFMKKNRNFTEKDILKILFCIGEAFKCLRKNRIVHRDVKPANLFMTKKDVQQSDIKLGDFTFAKKDIDLTLTTCGSPLYMAPEIILKERYNEKVDLWSIGIIIFELMYKEPPIKARSFIELIEKIKSQDISQLNKEYNLYSPSLKNLVSNLIKFDPRERIGFDQFFEEINKLLLLPSTHSNSSSLSISSSSSSTGSGYYRSGIVSSPIPGINLINPRVNPFKDISEPNDDNDASFVLIDSKTEIEKIEFEEFFKNINLVAEIAKTVMSRDNRPELSLGIYVFIFKILKRKIMAKSNSDLENLFKSLLSQAMIVKKFVDINSKVNYCEYLFEMAKECIKLHNSIQKTNIEKLPFSHANNLLDKAFSILTILKMGETTLDVDMYMQCIRMSIW